MVIIETSEETVENEHDLSAKSVVTINIVLDGLDDKNQFSRKRL